MMKTKNQTEDQPQVGCDAGLAGVGARSGLPFSTLRTMAKSKRMERGVHSKDPFYYHCHDCQGCEQECNGMDGRYIAEDAKDIQFSYARITD